MSIWDNAEGSAAVARQNAFLQNQANDAARNAEWLARQNAQEKAKAERARPSWIKKTEPGESAQQLAQHASPEWRQKQAQERLKVERQRERDAIEAAQNPRPKDPRTTAERLADGSGQAHIDL